MAVIWERVHQLTVKAQAKRNYSRMASDLDRLSADMLIVGDLETATFAADCAEVAERAYRAERDNPVPQS